MYCEHCGGTMNDDARYCSHCGGVRKVRVEPPTADGDFGPFTARQLDPDLVGEVRPWLRYWARMFDLSLLGIVAGIILEIFAPGALDGKILGNLFGFVCMAGWVLIEPLHLTSSGTTPGKWLFKTRVITTDGRRPTYEDALMRSFRVWWRGLAVGVPLVNLGTMIAAHEHLTNRGVTSWDRDGGFTVVHRRLGPGRVIAIICVVVAICALIGWGMTLDE
jgi:uncharacterized RDD family membrane protein YckC